MTRTAKVRGCRFDSLSGQYQVVNVWTGDCMWGRDTFNCVGSVEWQVLLLCDPTLLTSKIGHH